MGSYKNILENMILLDEEDGVEYIVIKNNFEPSYMASWLCGYVVFRGLPLGSPVYEGGLIDWVNCHGGLTYATYDGDDDKSIWGFDCAHAGDEGSIWQDPKVVMEEVKRLGIQIRVLIPCQEIYELANREFNARVEGIEKSFHELVEERLKGTGL